MKQPRVPEYREADGVSRYIKLLILFLKDFSMSVWTANNQRKKEIEAVSKSIPEMPEIPEVDYPVTSVNKKTGDVELSADDVGALAKNGTALDSEKLGGKNSDEYATADQGMPSGGTAGQVLKKGSNNDFDSYWSDAEDNGLTFELIYENPRPEDSFAEQTISLSVPDGVALLLVEFAESRRRVCTFASVDASDVRVCEASYINQWSGSVVFVTRTVYFYQNRMEIKGAYIGLGTTTATLDNTRIVPYRIFAVRRSGI